MSDAATNVFSVPGDQDVEIKRVMNEVYSALKQKGYNPINQIVGYILSEDPTYITTYGGARTKICRMDRDDILQAMVREYLDG